MNPNQLKAELGSQKLMVKRTDETVDGVTMYVQYTGSKIQLKNRIPDGGELIEIVETYASPSLAVIHFKR